MLGSEEIRKLIKEEALVTDYISVKNQLQPNGFDLTVKNIQKFKGYGSISFIGKSIPAYVPLIEKRWDGEVMEGVYDEVKRCWYLPKGVYLITFNEVLNLKTVSAITIQRSTLPRCGVAMNVGTWDIGYCGRGCSTMNVMNLAGFQVEKNAKIVQAHFFKVIGECRKYDGLFKGENI